MKNEKIVTINGQRYDAVTGLPIEKQAITPRPVKKPTEAGNIHPTTQRSQTLNRRVTKKPAAHTKPQPVRKPGRSMDIARSQSITRFAPHPVVKPKPAAAKTSADIGPTKHPLAAKATKKHVSQLKKAAPAVASVPKSSKIIKEEAITQALNQPKEAQKSKKSKGSKKNPLRTVNIVTIAAVLLLIAAYFTYVNLPNLSVGIASVQAGINASYPGYHPDGYSNSGLTFDKGTVSIDFKANAGTSKFTITQSKSNWDSAAVKEKVEENSNGEFLATQEKGLTIYTYGNGSSAMWVNGGILYSITGDAPLSGDQVRRIATSL
ncbi:MAG TPA: DUF4367 domain-containing protein [Candidatus Saccharimonadales bacterium]|nr:DUF4367 domain-containing protein [Candidatus Saccharimonadales bacterium]